MNTSPFLSWIIHTLQTRTIKYNLGESGIPQFSLHDFPVKFSDLDIRHHFTPDVLTNVSVHFNIPKENICLTAGCSSANFMVFSNLLKKGDRVLIESPVYDPLMHCVRMTGAQILEIKRPFENGFQLAIEDIPENIQMIILTNPHNPSGVRLKNIPDWIDFCTKNKIYLFIDEVFNENPTTAFSSNSEYVICTSSLTKTYGFGGLRFGWVLANKKLISEFQKYQFLLTNWPSPFSQTVAFYIFDNLELVRARQNNSLKNVSLIEKWIHSHPELSWHKPDSTIICFPKIHVDSDLFCKKLLEEYQTFVVPGSFFGFPDHVRIGFGENETIVSHGLKNISDCLKSF